MRTRRRRRAEGGQASIEYVGIVIVVAVILSAFVGTGILSPGIQAGYQRAICIVTSGGACAGSTGHGSNQAGGDQGDQSDQSGDQSGHDGDHHDGDHHGGGLGGFLHGVGDTFGSAWDGVKSLGGKAKGALSSVGKVAKPAWDFGATWVKNQFDLDKGILKGAWGDVKSLWDTIRHPVDTWNSLKDFATRNWNDLSSGFMDRWHKGDYLGALGFAGKKIGLGLVHTLVIDDDVIDAWKKGDYGEAVGRVVWNVGSWFIPVAGWAARGGKIAKITKVAQKAAKAAEKAAKAGKVEKAAARAAKAEKAAKQAEEIARKNPTKANKAAAARAREAADAAKIDARSAGLAKEAADKAATYSGSQVNYTISGGTATRAEAEALGKKWVGSGYRVASDGRTLISADGTRVYRPPSLKKSGVAAGKTQANFEIRDPQGAKGKKIKSDGHLTIDPP